MDNQRLVLNALRRADLLALSFECINLHLTADSRLERTDPEKPAVIIVHFPGQHIAEQAFLGNAAGAGPVDLPPVRTAIAGGSRLAFQLPDAVDSLPATLDALLQWDDWTPLLVATALPRAFDGAEPLPPLSTPSAGETAIEFPFRLILSPDKYGAWHHAPVARQLLGHTELWQTRLVQRQPDGPPTLKHEGADLRAVAFVDRQNTFTTSLSLGERRQIVRLSSDFTMKPKAGGLVARPGMSEAEKQARVAALCLRYNVPTPYRPQPIVADQLALSALGASARLHSHWDFPVLPRNIAQGLTLPALSLQQYEHIAGLGRDQYVKTVRVGFLCGTCHRAALVKVSERRFVNFDVAGATPEGALYGAYAYLHQYYQVVVQEPIVDYRQLSDGYQHEGREMPLHSIRLTTLVTPPLDLPISPTDIANLFEPDLEDPERRDMKIQDEIENRLNEPFWLEVISQKFMFQAVAEDADGSKLTFALPLMFVPYEALANEQADQLIRTKFDLGGPDVRRLDLHQQMVAFAPSAGAKPGSTHLKTASLTYDIEQPAGTDGSSKFLHVENLPPRLVVRYLPWITGTMATSPALEEMMGSAQPLPLELDLEHYLKNGFDSAQSFVKFGKPKPTLSMGARKGGGLARPDSSLDAISRTLGPIASPDKLAAGAVDVSVFADARILGTIPIGSILPDLPSFDAQTAAEIPGADLLESAEFKLNAPRLTTTRILGDEGQLAAVETRYLWKPELRNSVTKGVLTLELAGADLLIDARLTRQIVSSGSSLVVMGRLRNVLLSFAGAVAIRLGELLFRAEEGHKMEVGAKQVDLTFLGALEFVNTLRQILPADGFDDPPFVNVDAQGITAGYTLGIPSVGVGIFSLQNIALAATLSVPFSEKPAGFRFAISERHKPFLVTVTIFGGGGFFAIAVSADGLEQVEASIEFGGNISLNLGVASGGVFVMAGIYFNLTKASVELTGYLRCGGYLEVLGLISISVEFFLRFTWRKKAGAGSEVWGQATLTVCVKVAFFSKSVSLSVERRFAGSDGDPTFAQANTSEDWGTYLHAFSI